MATPQTICAETTATLVKPSPLNPLRRLLRKPLPTYTTHLFADAVVAPAPGTDGRDTPLPSLSIETKPDGRVYVVLNWSTPEGGTAHRVSVRERGANNPWRKSSLVQVHPPRVSTAVFSADHFQIYDPRPVEGVVRERTTLPCGGTVQSMTATTADGRTASLTIRSEGGHTALPFVGGRFTALPGEPAPPTQDTTVLHDLAFIADQLELAQTQVAMTEGGVGAGSMDNGAHVALCALRMVQAKLDVVASAADEAAVGAMAAMVRIENLRGGRTTGAYHSVKRSAAMLRQVTSALPLNPESARVAL